ncbi:DUF5667 domain-containing protein [Candidatus Parcubacteria bacterium]|nr:hypothetical protein [Patescibacteria group bacterium]MCG2688171.1 DUF5667 domain-containing protein [Candidatus Parcubacteria bacterium]
MNDRNLTKKLQLLKQIQPEKDWVSLNKRQLLGFEISEVKTSSADQILEIFKIGFNYKLVLVPLTIILAFGGTIGLSQASLPGDFLYPVRKLVDKTGYLFVAKENQPKLGLEVANKRLEELTVIAQNNQSKNLAPAINEFKQSTIEAAGKLKIVNTVDGSPKLTKEIVKETEKLRDNKEKIEALGIVVGNTEELTQALSQLVEREINDLNDRSLTDDQKQVLEQAKQNFEAGNYAKALEGILLLSYPQP